MIYRRWSLLTGPTSIVAVAVSSVIVADLLFFEKNAPFKRGKEKPEKSADK